MIIHPPKWVPQIPSIPDSTLILDFLLQENFGRPKLSQPHSSFVCGISGREYSVPEVSERMTSIAKGLLKNLQWEINSETQWEKVVGVFAFNSVRKSEHVNRKTDTKVVCFVRLVLFQSHGRCSVWTALSPWSMPWIPLRSSLPNYALLVQKHFSLVLRCYLLQ